MLGVDKTGKVICSKMLSSPLQRRPGGFGCIALAMLRRNEDPAQLRDGSKRGLQVAFEISETDLTHEVSGFFLLHDPISEAEDRPMTEITEKAGPALL